MNRGMDFRDSFHYHYEPSIFNKHDIYIKKTKDNFSLSPVGYYGFLRDEKGKLTPKSGYICFEEIVDVKKEQYKDYRSTVLIIREKNATCEVLFPGLGATDEIQRFIEDGQKREATKRAETEEKEAQRKALAEAQKIAPEVVDREYTQIIQKYASYIIEDSKTDVTFVYVGNDREIVIKSVGKKYGEFASASIPFEKIHYYEKAGAIHYVTGIDFNCSPQSFAGSFVPTKIHLTPAIIGALLAGPMGLAVGMAVGYEGAHFVDSKNNAPIISAKSTIHTIDDRSIVFNYYSDEKKQFMDIELPADIYNFLQTHYAEKKYDIVLASEKRKYVGDVSNTPAISQKNEGLLEIKSGGLDDFELAVKKLKLMRDNDLISEEEFNQKKNELLSRI